MARASSTALPRMWSHTSRALRGGRAHVLGLRADDRRHGRRRGAGSAWRLRAAAAVFAALSVVGLRRLGLGRRILGGLGASSFLRPRARRARLAGFSSARRLGLRRRAASGGGLWASSRSFRRPPRNPRLASPSPASASLAHRILADAGVAAELAGGRELAELVADHRLGDEDGHVLLAVVHRDRVADHLGEDRRGARPRLDHLLGARVFIASMRAFRRSSIHGPFLLERSSSTSSSRVAGRARCSGRTTCSSCGCGIPGWGRPRRHRVAAGGGRALAAAVRMVDGVHGGAARLRAHAHVALAPGLAHLDVLWSVLPIVPIVARHWARTMRISPEGRRSVACRPPWP